MNTQNEHDKCHQKRWEQICRNGKIDPAIMQKVMKNALRMKCVKCFAHEGIDDLQQQLLCKVLTCLDKFNPKKGQLVTFLNRALFLEVKRLITKQGRFKRGKGVTMMSLDQGVNAGDGNYDLNAHEAFSNVTDTVAKTELVADVHCVIEQLPEVQQMFCDMVPEFTITEIARLHGRTRISVYRELLSLRPLFRPEQPTRKDMNQWKL